MSFGNNAAQTKATAYNGQYGAQLQNSLGLGEHYMAQGHDGLQDVNTNLSNYMNHMSSSPDAQAFRGMLGGAISGQGDVRYAPMQAYQASAAGMNAQGVDAQGFSAQGAGASGGSSSAFDLGMRGQGFAEQYGANLGGFANYNTSAKAIADKLGSATDNPFAVLNDKFLEDAALQGQGQMGALGADLAARGLDSGGGVGAAALSQLRLGTNKQYLDNVRQGVVQGAQFLQQGQQSAAGIYNALSGLDLQRAAAQGQLGVQGYQADIQNAGRYDQVGMANAQNSTQASIASANNQTQANVSSAGNMTQASITGANNQTQANVANSNNSYQLAMNNAQMANQVGMANNSNSLQAQQFNSSQKMQGISAYGNFISQLNDSQLRGYGQLSNNYQSAMGLGGQLYGGALQGMGNLGGMYNQNAGAEAQGNGNFLGSLLNLGGTLLGGVLGGPIGAGIGGGISNTLFGQRK